MVKIVECPRDAWEGLAKQIPPEVKADYLRLLIAAGFRHLDAVSFWGNAAVPEVGEAERVLEYLGATNDVEIIGWVRDETGAERAIETGALTTLGFPYSISPGSLKRNQNQTPEELLEALEAVGTLADKAGLKVVGYVSMAFGNPYGDAWSIDEVIDACDLLVNSGVTEITLADTAGLATPRLVADLMADVLAVHDRVEIGVHLHAAREGVPGLVRAAYAAGCRRFDAALGGLGGSPPAGNVLIGNLPTEELLRLLRELGATLPVLTPLEGLLGASAEIARRYGAPVQ